MELVSSLQNEAVRDNNDIEGLGGRWDSSSMSKTLDMLNATSASAAVRAAAVAGLMPEIAAGSSKVVNFKVLSGLFNQPKFLPLKFMPIVLEFELGDATDAIVTPQAYGGGFDLVYTEANTSNKWEMFNCCIKCDICTLDNALNNSYVEHLLSGKSLPIEYSTYISQQSSISGKSFSVQVIRAVSRLQRAFITFFSNTYTGPFAKPALVFYHPMYTSASYNPDKELQFQLQLGSKLIPEYPCQSLSECFYHLKKTLNLPDHHQHSIGINFKSYSSDKFIFGLSFEKIPDAEWSGINTKAGQILMVIVKAMNQANLGSDNIANIMYTVLECQNILQISDVGCTVYD